MGYVGILEVKLTWIFFILPFALNQLARLICTHNFFLFFMYSLICVRMKVAS